MEKNLSKNYKKNYNIVIETRHIIKEYRIPHEKTNTLFGQILGRFKGKTTYENFRALNDVSFSLHKGEMVGLIGKNGSGKTTLLKILGGIIQPSSGSFTIEGTVAPLIGLGVGFHGELSAEENLYLYGAILGMPRKKIKEKLDEIFSFAGVERFRNMKLKHFSSGMVARLAFSTMVQADPDILLLDEIFSVGDKDFIPQCLTKIAEYRQRGKTILFASHDLSAIEQQCERTILLDKGELKMFGPTKDVVQYYKTI